MTSVVQPAIEVRPVNPEELEAFGYVTHTTLASHGNKGFNDPMVDMRPEWTLACSRTGRW